MYPMYIPPQCYHHPRRPVRSLSPKHRIVRNFFTAYSPRRRDTIGDRLSPPLITSLEKIDIPVASEERGGGWGMVVNLAPHVSVPHPGMF